MCCPPRTGKVEVSLREEVRELGASLQRSRNRLRESEENIKRIR